MSKLVYIQYSCFGALTLFSLWFHIRDLQKSRGKHALTLETLWMDHELEWITNLALQSRTNVTLDTQTWVRLLSPASLAMMGNLYGTKLSLHVKVRLQRVLTWTADTSRLMISLLSFHQILTQPAWCERSQTCSKHFALSVVRGDSIFITIALFLLVKSHAVHWIMLTRWSMAPSREADSKVFIKDSIRFYLFAVLRVNWFSLLLRTLFIPLPVPICSRYLLASGAATISLHSGRQMRAKPKAELFCAAIDK